MNIWNTLYSQSQQLNVIQQAVDNIQLNENVNQYAKVNALTSDWVASPAKGILRLLLERNGGEKTMRATSIVAYEPNSHFAPHVHPLGEEFFVLAGTFSDEAGDYPAGTYVRNPPQSSHQPFSHEGCLIFVKLQQFQVNDRQQVVIHTDNHSSVIDQQGWARQCLFDGYERVELITATDDIILSNSGVNGGMELLILSGVLSDESNQHQAGTWLRLPDSYSFSYRAQRGTQLWLKSGHLNK